MAKSDDLQRLLDGGIVAILRATDGSRLVEVVEALLAGGVETIEVTFTVPQAHRVLEQVTSKLGRRVLLGAGTVLDTETARIAMLSGAEFVVSPCTNLDVIAMCRRYDKLVMPGAFTPTEIVSAWQAGADIVKVFPCDSLGPGYLKAVRGPLPQVRLLPTGGVNLETAASFLQAGACALGLGSSLVEASALAKNDLARIESLARQYVAIVAQTAQGDEREMNVSQATRQTFHCPICATVTRASLGASYSSDTFAASMNHVRFSAPGGVLCGFGQRRLPHACLHVWHLHPQLRRDRRTRPTSPTRRRRASSSADRRASPSRSKSTRLSPRLRFLSRCNSTFPRTSARRGSWPPM